MKTIWTASYLALALACAAAPAQEQDAAAPVPDKPAPVSSTDTDIVVTAERGNQTQVVHGGDLGVLGTTSALDAPFEVRGYDSTLILNQQPLTLGAVLENDPSVRTTYGYGNAAEQFIIRGFPLAGDDVGFNGLYGIAPRQLVAPELYDQVQVLNGASAFLNGAAPGGSGIGGSVNLIPKRAGATALTRVTADYSSDSMFGGSADVSRRFDDGALGVRLNGAFRSGDDSIDGEFRRTGVVGGAFDYAGSNLRISADIDYQRVTVRHLRPKVTLATTTLPRVPDADANYAQDFTYTNLRDIFGDARIEWDVAPNATLYVQGGARDGSEDGIYGGITVTDAATGDGTGNALYVPRTDNNEAVQGGIRVKLAAGGITQQLNFGGSYVWQVDRNAYDFDYGPGFAGFATNLYHTQQVPLPSSTLVGGDLDDPFPVGRTRLGSAFASDTVGFADDRVLVTGGLRLQAIDEKSYSYADGSLQTEYDDDAVTPVVGIVVKPTRFLSLYANRIEGLAPGPTAPLDSTIINSGEIFAPYKSTQYEVGGKLALGPVNASLAVYQIREPSAFAIPDPQGSGLLRYGLYGEQRNRGIEFNVDGTVTKGLRVIAGVSAIEARLSATSGGTNDGDTAPGVPDYEANANVEWDLPFLKGATLTGRVVQTGKQQANAANTIAIPSWTRFDLGGRYVLVAAGKPVTLRVGVDNVANNRYWTSAYDTFSTALLQGMPRTYRASLSVDF